jgi:hypothetical protein
MTKQNIIDYVMNTPENTNRAVLSSMLDSVSGGGTEPLILEWDSETSTTNKTWQEVYNALASGVPCYERSISSETAVSESVANVQLRPIIKAAVTESTYSIYVLCLFGDNDSVVAVQYSTDAPNNYFEA